MDVRIINVQNTTNGSKPSLINYVHRLSLAQQHAPTLHAPTLHASHRVPPADQGPYNHSQECQAKRGGARYLFIDRFGHWEGVMET